MNGESIKGKEEGEDGNTWKGKEMIKSGKGRGSKKRIKETREGNRERVKEKIGRKGGDTSHTEEEEEEEEQEEEEEVWSPRGAAVGRWRPLLELPEVLHHEEEARPCVLMSVYIRI
ncbi:hypothetical protein EYF80_060662 [Liparis tanakae]|uniref:Uncharacterized protein n=1 Tax=Liparis tanakae TaxID=230148 RepID=A0A4Z2EKT0_9TELE|nr:hypothetical protein EYF80_060662 [Liparis tanakae]